MATSGNKKKDAESLRKWASEPAQIDYTCGCGLLVNPNNPLRRLDAIHISDCVFYMWPLAQNMRKDVP